MALTSTLVKQPANDNDIHLKRITAIQEDISNVDKKAAFLENNLYSIKKQYENNTRKYDDNNLISKSFVRIENYNEIEETIKTPEVFFSPRKDDRYHDAESNDDNNNHIKYNKHDETESPTYTARSFKIETNDYFDESSHSDYDNDNDNLFKHKIDNSMIKINQQYKYNNWLPNLWNEKNVSEMMLTKLASSCKTIISSKKNKSLSKSHFNNNLKNKKNQVSSRKDYDNNSVKVKKVKIKKTNKRVKQTASKSTTASRHINILPEGKYLRKHSNRRGKRLLKINNKIETPKQVIINHKFNDDDDDDEKTNKIIEIIETNENGKEIVELFSNTAAKSDQSLSATSSDPKFKLNIIKSPLRMVDKKIKKSINYQIKNENIIEEKIKPDGDNTRITTTTLSRKKENEIKNNKSLPIPAIACNFSYDNQSLTTLPTYQRPTIASQQKRKNRCYYGRYSYQYIPFVVGTSINRTHNIGLNIQLAMSLIKARHTNEPADIRPMLIKKFRRGLNPAYNLKDNFIQLEENFNKTNKHENIELTQSQELNKVTQNINNINDINDIRNIMIELHNNFEKLQLKQEKLQDEAGKSTNKKKIDEELKKLEIELTIKEKEINEIVALYYHEIKKTTTVNENSRTASTSTRLTALLRKIQSFQQQLITL